MWEDEACVICVGCIVCRGVGRDMGREERGKGYEYVYE